MKSNKIIIIILCIILGLIIYKLYKNDKTYKNNIEHFGILNNLNNKKKNKKNNNKKNNNNNNNNDNDIDTLSLKQKISKLKSKKTGATFEDLLKATEDMNPEKLSLSNMKEEFYKYNNSFKKEKFKNNSKSTAESFEKFAFYKEKFFEIFK